MTLSGLRHSILEKVSKIEDEDFLNAIKVILDTKNVSSVFKLSPMQSERVELVRLQHEQGQTMLHDELLSEIEQWLRTK